MFQVDSPNSSENATFNDFCSLKLFNLGKPLETFVVGYFNYFCLICLLQTAESLPYAH